jgi:hypothetical protein
MQVFDGPENAQKAQNTESATGGVQGQMVADDYGQMELSF